MPVSVYQQIVHQLISVPGSVGVNEEQDMSMAPEKLWNLHPFS